MRKIKLRAWLPDRKRMTSCHTLEELMDWNLNIPSSDTTIWMQYTGLKDKNGREIYEGDVVEFEHGGRVRAYVIYKDGSFEVKNDKADVLLYLYVIYHKAEIIGNIYENPDLIMEVTK